MYPRLKQFLLVKDTNYYGGVETDRTKQCVRVRGVFIYHIHIYAQSCILYSLSVCCCCCISLTTFELWRFLKVVRTDLVSFFKKVYIKAPWKQIIIQVNKQERYIWCKVHNQVCHLNQYRRTERNWLCTCICINDYYYGSKPGEKSPLSIGHTQNVWREVILKFTKRQPLANW